MSEPEYKLQIPREVESLCAALFEAGEQAYVVGGSIRDLLSGRTPTDWDIATSATPPVVMKLFRRVIPTGIDHGTVTVLIDDKAFEVTTLRGEGEYSDGRHPDKVIFISDIDDDLSRRDFTVNAMAWDPLAGRLHDPFDGCADLKARIIRAVGDPVKRFEEDGLRVLRAARFAAALEFEIEPLTLQSMPSAAASLSQVSAERKRDEFVKTLGAPTPSIGLNLMAQTKLICRVSEQLADLANVNINGGLSEAWQRTVRRVDITQNVLHLRLAALLMEISGGVDALLKDMRLDRKTITKVVHQLKNLTKTNLNTAHTDPDIRRLLQCLGRAAVDDFFALKTSDLLAREEPLKDLKIFKDRADSILASGAALSIKELTVRGSDILTQLKVPPGPHVGQILNTLLKHVLDNPRDNTPEILIEIAQKLSR